MKEKKHTIKNASKLFMGIFYVVVSNLNMLITAGRKENHSYE